MLKFARYAAISCAALIVIGVSTDSRAAEVPILRLAQSQPRATELRLRSAIEKIQAGNPNYDEMEPFLRAAVKNQYSVVVPRLQSMGSIKSISFEGSQNGQDVYNVTFANGALVWGIALTPNGKIAALYFN